MSNKFECKKCGSGELAFSSYVKCLIPAVIKEDEGIEYLEAVVDSDDYIQNTSYFCCYGCGSQVGDFKEPLRTEEELLVYLNNEVVS